MHQSSIALVGLLLLLFSLGAAEAKDADDSELRYRHGSVRFAAFFVTGIDTELQLDLKGAPLGTRVDLTDDLGIKNRETVPKINLNYRFSKHHSLDFGWFNIKRDGQKRIEKTINFIGKEFLIDTEVDSFIDTELYALQYTWIFYESDKVLLGLSAGLNVFRIDTGIGTTEQDEPRTKVGVTAPLPAAGLRMIYRVNHKLHVAASSNLFVIEYGAYKGSITEFAVAVEHHTFKHVGFGGSLEHLATNVEIDDSEAYWDIKHVFTGYTAYVAVYF